MLENKCIKYLVVAMIIFSVTISWGAYAAAIAAFIMLFIYDRALIVNIIVQEKSIILIIIALLLSTIFSNAQTYSLLLGAALLVHIMAFVVLVAVIKQSDLNKIFKLLNHIGIIVCIIGIYQFITGDLIIDKTWTDQKTFGNLVRIYATLDNPNIFAGYLTMNLSYSVAYLLKKKFSISIALNTLLSLICLILTYSRGGFIAFFAAMIVVLILCRNIRMVMFMIIAAAVYYGYNSLGDFNRANLGLMNSDGSSLYRIEIWKASLNLFYENTSFGSGLGSVLKNLAESSPVLDGRIAHAHNIVLQLLAETGAFGLITFIMLMQTWIKRFMAYWQVHMNSEYAFYAIGYAASLAAFMVHGIVDCVAFIPTRSLIFLVYLSLFPVLYYRSGMETAFSSVRSSDIAFIKVNVDSNSM